LRQRQYGTHEFTLSVMAVNGAVDRHSGLLVS
jgi:hypothetical protein